MFMLGEVRVTSLLTFGMYAEPASNDFLPSSVRCHDRCPGGFLMMVGKMQEKQDM